MLVSIGACTNASRAALTDSILDEGPYDSSYGLVYHVVLFSVVPVQNNRLDYRYSSWTMHGGVY